MHTRLALATIATVKAGTYILCARRPTTTPAGPPASRIRTSHIMESGASATILKERAKRKEGGEGKEKGTGARGEVHTREPKYRLRSKLVTSLCPLVARVSYELANEKSHVMGTVLSLIP